MHSKKLKQNPEKKKKKGGSGKSPPSPEKPKMLQRTCNNCAERVVLPLICRKKLYKKTQPTQILDFRIFFNFHPKLSSFYGAVFPKWYFVNINIVLTCRNKLTSCLLTLVFSSTSSPAATLAKHQLCLTSLSSQDSGKDKIQHMHCLMCHDLINHYSDAKYILLMIRNCKHSHK